jgi:hypothetical protein
MAININANMSLGSAQYLDSRQSVADLDTLLALDTNIIPNGFECYVQDLDCKYKYNISYNDPITGHWKFKEEEKEGLFLTREEYDQLEAQGLVEMNRNYYIIGSPAPTVQQIDAIVEEKMNQALGNSGDGTNEQTEATINDWFND